MTDRVMLSTACSQDMPVNTKQLYNICTMLDQRQRRWVDVVQMLYKCFVFAGMSRGTSIIMRKNLGSISVYVTREISCH